MLQITVEHAMQIALQHHQAGRFSEAEAIYRKVLGHQRDHPEAHFNLGNVLVETGSLDEAIAAYREALRLRPGYADALTNLGIAFARMRQFDDAIASYRDALLLRPGSVQTLNNLGSALKQSGKLDEAIETYRGALALNPGFADAHCNLGNALAKKRCFDEAVVSYRRALRLMPDDPEALNNMGVALRESDRTDEALAAFEHAIRLSPQWANPHWNLAMMLLLRGELQRGWAEYEWRWKWSEFTSPSRNFPQPQWNGEDLDGRTILLHAEQGFGDTIQFVRYAPLVAHRGGRVILLCQPELARLLRDLPGAAVAPEKPLADFDVHCPLLSLPHALGTTVESIPSSAPYLHADAGLAESWSRKLGWNLGEKTSAMTRLRVGLAWAGMPTHINDENRSIALSQLAPLWAIPGVTFYSLQKGHAAAQAAGHPPGMELIDLTADLHDFAETAGLISQLDLVISVDTAVAHLAGALGKPVWVLLPLRPDWRWMLGREDSPWYPTMRLFRQQSADGWAAVIERVAQSVASFRDDRLRSSRAF